MSKQPKDYADCSKYYKYVCDSCGIASQEQSEYHGEFITGIGSCAGCGGRKMRLVKQSDEHCKPLGKYDHLLLGSGLFLFGVIFGIILAVEMMG